MPLASAADMEKFYAHLEQVLDEIDFRTARDRAT